MTAKGFALFDGGSFDLNLIALRNTPGTLDAFDDLLVCLYKDEQGRPQYRTWICTTDPGKPAIEHPTRSDGTAVIALGQHRGALTFGLHHGRYECLVPVKNLPVLRFKSAADYAAGLGTPSKSASTQIHHANSLRPSTVVGAWSEGCIVIADPQDFLLLMQLAHRQVDAGHGRTFTLTVLEWPQAAQAA